MERMNNFFIITNTKRDRDLSVTDKTRKFLESNGCNVCVLKAGSMEDGHYTMNKDVPENTDCVITIGGDGTLIAAARDTVDLGLPILGINQGTLGYLTDVEVDNIEGALKKLMEGNYTVEDRMMLCGKVLNVKGEVKAESRALNDIVLHNTRLSTSDYKLFVNSRFLSDFRADGMIVCTPTGSTAYSMSAGGPIIEPMARMMVITPVCPHKLNTRSVVISADDVVDVEVMDDTSSVTFDGYMPYSLTEGDTVNVRISSHVTRIIKIEQDSFLNVLSNKLRS